MLEELDLVNKAKQGNKSALNTLLTNNFNVLKGYIIKMTGNKVLSEDIIQESMLKAVLNIHKFKPEYKFSTWIIKISTNVYIDYLRKNKVSEEINDNIDIGSISLEDSVINSLEYEEVMNILLNISYEKRAVFILKHYYGYKYEEIAQIMKCPVGTVRSRLNNAIKQIASEFEERGLI
ncbi:RNA polymerase sigma factor SigY [Candidatus Clostridium stratigraminis]|uniref:RNA polymerase sigma factor SigY n=1 Tax=Candidatus Clostridium stratigraminis TaxID=3381661 RepID=A0ABW8T2R7_9CLOT